LNRLIVPLNITLIPLPPKYPGLNPQENISQFMPDNWLSNRVFKSFDDIVGHCCDAWNDLVDQPWKIMSIGLRDWAHDCRTSSLGIINRWWTYGHLSGCCHILSPLQRYKIAGIALARSRISVIPISDHFVAPIAAPA
jgi:hypothetical protein